MKTETTPVRHRQANPPPMASSGRTAAVSLLAAFAFLVLLAMPAHAQTTLSVEPITWDVIGLDSNKVETGPDKFPVGVRVCNTGGVEASNVVASFVWESANAYINTRLGTATTLPVPPETLDLAAGACTDFYFEVAVTRTAAAYDTTRRYRIDVTADGLGTFSSPTPRQLYVEQLVSQFRNYVWDVLVRPYGTATWESIPAGGAMTLVVGEEYEIKLDSQTATNGYEQIESFINFPNTIFQILEVETNYTAESSASMEPAGQDATNFPPPLSPDYYDALYGDACDWQANPLSPAYRSCLATGKAGGGVVVIYRVKILSVPTAPLLNPESLNTLIYDFSGSSYHYNANYGASGRYVYITDPDDALAFQKSFRPDTTVVDGVSTLTFTITNLTLGPVGGINFTDVFPTSPGAMVVATPAAFSTSGCGTPTFAPTAGAGSISFSDGSIGPLGVCTISVSVTTPAEGLYTNTSGPLYIGTTNTGLTATDDLTVGAGQPRPNCTGPEPITGIAGIELARWTMEPSQGTTAPPAYSYKSTYVSGATASLIGGTEGISTEGNPSPNAWSGLGWAKDTALTADTTPYFEFELDTSQFTDVTINFNQLLIPSGDWAANNNNTLYVWSSADGGPWANLLTVVRDKGKWQLGLGPLGNEGTPLTAAQTGTGTTRFRVMTNGAKLPTAGLFHLDNAVFTGCGYAYPKISKSFSPNPVAVGATSTLTFVLTNDTSVALTGLAFTDVLPAGLEIAAGTPTNGCGGTLTATAGTALIELAGGTLAARSSTPPFTATTCQITVPVLATTAGPHLNISGYVSSAASGPNTGPDGSAQANLTALLPPVISKAFAAETIPAGTSTLLTFLIENPNSGDAISGVSFTDTYPSGLINATLANAATSCAGGTVTATNGGTSVSLAGASLDGGASCTVTVWVTSLTAGTYPNTSGPVQHVVNGVAYGTDTASDTLEVRAVAASLALSKEVSSSSTGPWSPARIIAAGTEVYYRFVVENTGDAPLTGIVIDDPTVSTSSCVGQLSDPLPPASVDDDNELHITSCIVGPFSAQAGSVPNTATAEGTYGGNTVTSNQDSAVYQNGNFGHLPAAYTNMNLFNDGGAMHLNGDVYLGASLTTTDADGINSETYVFKATDDGVTWTPALPWGYDEGGSIDVIVTCPIGTCYLSGWIDWNQDGDFLDEGETIRLNLAVTQTPPNTRLTLTFPIPEGAVLDGTNIYSRFRLSNLPMTDPLPYGQAFNGTTALIGEIEDPFFQVIDGNVPTPVTLASFVARREAGHTVRFAWTTATETGNVGFHLYVQDGKRLKRINEELIPSRTVDSLDRQAYEYRAEVKGEVFFIEDVSVFAEARRHGPFALGEEHGARLDDEKVAWPEIGRELAAFKRADRAAALAGKSSARGIGAPSTPLFLQVRGSGIQRVGYEALRAAGLDLAGVAPQALRLTAADGAAVPLWASSKRLGPGTFLEFVGEALDTIYTDTNVYTLRVASGATRMIPEIGAGPGLVPVVPASYPETFVLNRQRSYANYAPSEDAWYDTSMLAYRTPKSWEVPFQLDALADPYAVASAELTVWGVTNWPQSPDHHLVAEINGVPVVDEQFDGLVEMRWRFELPPGTLREGANTLRFTLPGDTGVDWDMVNFDRLEIGYARRFEAKDGRLTFTGTDREYQVTGLPSPDVVVYRVDRQGPQRLANVRVEAGAAGYTATFAGQPRPATYFVSTVASLHAPAIETPVLRSELERRADYLVIAHPAFIAGLEPLLQAREARGLSVNVVDARDLYTAYTGGVFDPEAIREYVAYAAAELGTRSVLLVGGDTYDYRNYLGRNSISFVPSLYASTGQYVRFVPSDALYADVDDDGVPDVAIGRLPVRTAAELDLVVAKTLAYEEKDYGRTAAFAADRRDGALSFQRINQGFMQALPAGWTREGFGLDDLDVATARARLLVAMNRGTALVTFTGHSGPREWTFSGLFNSSHAATLTNEGRPFVVVQWGCWNTYYVDPVNTYLVHSFLFSGDRGAAAVLGAATLTDAGSEELLGRLLTPRLATPGMTLGRALQEAKAELARTHPHLADVLIGWTLMGDPELVVEP